MKANNPLRFLEQYESENTVNSYMSALRAFFKTIYGRSEPLRELAETYFSEQRDHQRDVEEFLIALKNYAPKTVRLKLSAIRVFLLENNVELPQLFWRRIRGRIKGSRALTLDKIPSNLELRKIIMHLPVQGKALFLMLASSGMRIGEALKLSLEDVDLNVDPARVSIRGEYTKSGNPRVTFISREAREAINEWLKVRKKYLVSASARSRYNKKTEDKRLFPFSDVNARLMWNNALEKAGNGRKDHQTKIHEMHPHVLRKFFRTKLGSVIPVDVVEALMGHEGYLTEVYRRYSMETLADFYRQGEHALLVFTEAAEVSKLKEEIEERNRQLQALVNGLTAENLELKTRLSRMELEHTEFKKRILREIEELKRQLQDLIS